MGPLDPWNNNDDRESFRSLSDSDSDSDLQMLDDGGKA